MFEIGQVGVPAQRHRVDVHHPELWRQEVEVYHLGSGPHTPVCLVKLPELVFELIKSVRKRSSLCQTHTYEVPHAHSRRGHQLVHQNLLADSLQRPPHIDSVQPGVPVMEDWTQRAAHSEHTTCPRPVPLPVRVLVSLPGLLQDVPQAEHHPAAHGVGQQEVPALEQRLPEEPYADQELFARLREHVRGYNPAGVPWAGREELVLLIAAHRRVGSR